MDRPALRKTTLEVRVPLHTWWKAEALRRRLTMVGYVEQLLEREKAKADRTAERRERWAHEDKASDQVEV